MKIKVVDNILDFRNKTGYNGYLPLFLNDNYKNYITSRKSNHKCFLLLYDNFYIIPVLIRKYYIFKSAEFECSCYKYGVGEKDQKSFLDDVCWYLKCQLGVQWLIETPPYALFDAYPTNAKTIRFANTAVYLEQDEEKAFSLLSHSFKKEVKRALKNGVECRTGKEDCISDFALMEAATWRRSGNTMDHTHDNYYQDLFNHMRDNIIVSMVYKDNVPQAGEVSFYDNDICYGMFAARNDGMIDGCNRLAHWQTMQWCIKNHIKKYVIVGYRLKVDEDSKIARIQHFKDSFNGIHEEGFMFTITFKKRYVWLYNKVLSLLSFIKTGKLMKNKGGGIISQEIHKWPEYND